MKKNLLPLACFSLFCVVMYVLPITTENYSPWNKGDAYFPELHIGWIVSALGILSVVIPIYLFMYKMNRRSVDLYYALPLNRTKILVAHFLVGLILLYGAYTFSFFWGFLIVALKVRRLHLIWYLYLYLATLIPAFVAYSVTAFIFTRANTVIDGIICVAGAMCVFAVTLSALDTIMDRVPDYYDSLGSFFFPFSSLSQLTSVMENAIIEGKAEIWFTSGFDWKWKFWEDFAFLAGGILWTLLGIGATVGLVKLEKNSKAENCGQRSESIFCFKTQIPIYTVLLSIIALEDIAALCALLFGIFVLCIVYKRTIKIGWKFAIIVIGCILGGILLRVIPSLILENIYPTIWN